MYNIKISEEEMSSVEVMFYDYNALKDLFELLSLKENIQKEQLVFCLNELKEAYKNLEREKNRLAIKYLPEELHNKNYNYNFNFISECIEYKEEV